MKRLCQNCGGIIIYPPEKKVKYRVDVDGWVCDSCYISLKRVLADARDSLDKDKGLEIKKVV
ncbi:MAG: hypothetical protein QXX68_03480 [Candidatus Pacearchaeota archaeon]